MFQQNVFSVNIYIYICSLTAFYSDQDLPDSNQSLRILSNLVAAGAFSSTEQIDELIKELLLFTRSVVAMQSGEVIDLITKVHHLRV